MLYEVITTPVPAFWNTVAAPVTAVLVRTILRVITSYSIHYTKLYDFGSATCSITSMLRMTSNCSPAAARSSAVPAR